MAVDLDQVEDAADVGRDDLARRAHLATHQFQHVLVNDGAVQQGLEGDLDTQLQVPRTPNLSHSPTPQQFFDAVTPAQDQAGGEGTARFSRRRRAGGCWLALFEGCQIDGILGFVHR